MNTTFRMQELNEAYLILKDPEAREKYDKEYQRFKIFKEEKISNQNQQKKTTDENSNFKIEDDILNHWINNAKKQAIDLAQQTIQDFKGVSRAATTGFKEGITQLLIWVVLANFIFLLAKSCEK